MNRASLRLARTAREALGDVLSQGQLGDRIDDHQAAHNARKAHPARARRRGTHGGDQHAGTDDGLGGDGGVVESYVSYLRKKIDTEEPRLINTIRGVGYVLREPR